MRAAGYRNLFDSDRARAGDRLEGVFVVEGARTIRHLLDAGWPLQSVLLSAGRAAARADLVGDALAGGAAVYTTGQDVFDHIVGYHVHRGALALAVRPAPAPVEGVARSAELLLVVEGVSDHENVGSLFRNAAAFGVGAVVVDPATADPLYRRAVRVSLGAVLRVPFARSDRWPADLDHLRSMGFRLVALSPGGDVDVAELAVGRGERLALLVGSEGDGLSAAALARADVTVRIPMAAGADSVNVATAAAIALHRVARLAGPGEP
ncbi:MAG TPA: RNA methyltransferase [Acidimicrobiales bacterium]|nr:RNA methyltransferase [Acidimicrobiales bacterium]